MEGLNAKLVELWLEASRDLDIRVVAPHVITPPTGDLIACEVLLPDFGSPNGAIILSAKTERRVRSALKSLGVTWIAIERDGGSRKYTRSNVIDTFNDFGWFGVAEKRPIWLVERR